LFCWAAWIVEKNGGFCEDGFFFLKQVLRVGVPRESGDEPRAEALKASRQVCSPREWGGYSGVCLILAKGAFVQ